LRQLPIPFINVQLGFWSILATAGIIVVQDYDKVVEYGFFSGYTTASWLAILTSSAGGLLVAAIIRATSNLAKTYAVSFAILLADVISYFMFDKPIDSAFWAAAMVVIISSMLYLEAPARASTQPSTHIKRE
jgi:drug/metabolite transporter (DMT)-like permease